MMAFIDSKGMIRAQYIGDNEHFFTDGDKNIRAELDKLLGVAPKAAPKTMTKTIESNVKSTIKK